MALSKSIVVISLMLLAICVVVHPVVDLLQTIVAPTHHSASLAKKLALHMPVPFQAILLVQFRSLESRHCFSLFIQSHPVLESTCALLC